MSPFRSCNLRSQRGIGMISLACVIVVIGGGVLLGMRIMPSAMEYKAIGKAAQKASLEGTPAAIRNSFDRAAAIDNITSISGVDLDITPKKIEGTGFLVGFAYKKELPLFGPASLLINYAGSTH